MYEEYRRGYPRDEEFMHGFPLEEEYIRRIPREEEYVRRTPREEEYMRSSPREEEYMRGYPREEEYMRGSPNEEEFMRGSPHEEEFMRNSPREEYKQIIPLQVEDEEEEEEVITPKIECTSTFPNNVTVGLKDKTFFATRSVVGTVGTVSFLDVDIPANAAITKITASILQTPGNPIDSGLVALNSLPLEASAALFVQDFNKNPDDRVAAYETTFIQPYCVGPGGARASLIAYYRTIQTTAQALRLTIVYCPDYCS